ncbi:MAG: branched-chain amino acid ABC transporter permease, partial [Deltaproteobacteria bacterium]|nr:branched-chain amino acid ABC transporter permease [Deltaproteobacteria bacterium]
MELFLQLIVTGVMLGSIFALVALGWVLIYKCSGVLNLAMGELTMIGGYVCLAFYQRFVTIMPINYAFIFALIGTIFVGLILGLLTERIFLRKMIGQPILAVIMVTVGLSFFFKGMVFMIWDTDTQVFLPRIFSIEPIVVGGIAVGAVYLWSFIAAMILMVVFICFFYSLSIT